MNNEANKIHAPSEKKRKGSVPRGRKLGYHLLTKPLTPIFGSHKAINEPGLPTAKKKSDRNGDLAGRCSIKNTESGDWAGIIEPECQRLGWWRTEL